jgi:hypothetical protein
LDTATDRFERRLIEQTSALRLEMAAMRVSLIRRMIGLLVAQTGLICGVMSLMFGGLRR